MFDVKTATSLVSLFAQGDGHDLPLVFLLTITFPKFSLTCAIYHHWDHDSGSLPISLLVIVSGEHRANLSGAKLSKVDVIATHFSHSELLILVTPVTHKRDRVVVGLSVHVSHRIFPVHQLILLAIRQVRLLQDWSKLLDVQAVDRGVVWLMYSFHSLTLVHLRSYLGL